MSRHLLPYAAQARRHLRRKDPALHPILERVGPFAMRRETNRFVALAWSIIAQQISIKAAAAIRKRLLDQFHPNRLSPALVHAANVDQLRAAGLSAAKARYLKDLAEKAHTGAVDLRNIHRADDETVIERLTRIKGIGRWTAEMFLIFSLGRPDVLPVDDLGLRVAVQRLCGLPALPGQAEVRERGAVWHPYRSVATWYLWQSLKS